jgi:hypothetical protein
MMGRRRRDQGRLFYEFHLDDRVSQNHLLRRIDVFATAALADLHKELYPYYSAIGRPSERLRTGGRAVCPLVATRWRPGGQQELSTGIALYEISFGIHIISLVAGARSHLYRTRLYYTRGCRE